MSRLHKPNMVILEIQLRSAVIPVWRIIEIPLKSTLHQLHLYIQAAMGWTCSHLYEFKIGDSRYQYFFPDQEIDDEEGDPTLDSTKFSLKDFNLSPGRRFSYEYDFGDSWIHDVYVKSLVPEFSSILKVPCCSAGAMACPPENIGGIDIYNMLVQFRLFKTPTGIPEMEKYYKDFDIYDLTFCVRSFSFDGYVKRMARSAYG